MFSIDFSPSRKSPVINDSIKQKLKQSTQRFCERIVKEQEQRKLDTLIKKYMENV